MFKYKTWCSEIKKVEYIKETQHFVTLQNGVREAKCSDMLCYFDTYKEAKDYLIKEALANVDYSKMRLDQTREDLKEVEALKE